MELASDEQLEASFQKQAWVLIANHTAHRRHGTVSWRQIQTIRSVISDTQTQTFAVSNSTPETDSLAQEQPADATEAIDADIDAHCDRALVLRNEMS